MVDKMMVAQGVANRLFATETAIDAAMVEASQLMGAMLTSREELHMSASVGDEAVAKIAQALATLSTARQQVVAAHEELAEVKLRLGIRTRMMGEQQKTKSSASVDLRAVG